MFLIRFLILIEHLNLSGMWSGVTPRTDAKDVCLKEIVGLCAKKKITILGSIVNILGGPYMTI